jgi:hypothetical protein
LNKIISKLIRRKEVDILSTVYNIAQMNNSINLLTIDEWKEDVFIKA